MEFAIGFSLTLLKQLNSTEFTDEEFEGSMEFFAQKTFGRLIGEFRKKIDLDENSISAVKIALDERNYIVHNIFNDMGEELATPEGRRKVLARVIEARKKMRSGFEIFDGAVKALIELSGLSFEEFQNEAKNRIEV